MYFSAAPNIIQGINRHSTHSSEWAKYLILQSKIEKIKKAYNLVPSTS